jgi:hypothetical protein
MTATETLPPTPDATPKAPAPTALIRGGLNYIEVAAPKGAPGGRFVDIRCGLPPGDQAAIDQAVDAWLARHTAASGSDHAEGREVERLQQLIDTRKDKVAELVVQAAEADATAKRLTNEGKPDAEIEAAEECHAVAERQLFKMKKRLATLELDLAQAKAEATAAKRQRLSQLLQSGTAAVKAEGKASHDRLAEVFGPALKDYLFGLAVGQKVVEKLTAAFNEAIA